jgi:hypothetical protein
MEELLVRLEENERLMESLEVESTAASKGGAAKTPDKKGKQSIANPAIQQQPKCTSCGSEHDVSQCPKEKARLQKEAKQRGEKLPGPERSSRRGNQQPDQRQTAEAGDDDSGCYMCFALGRGQWMTHDVSKCWKKKMFNERLQVPEHCVSIIKQLSTKTKTCKGR